MLCWWLFLLVLPGVDGAEQDDRRGPRHCEGDAVLPVEGGVSYEQAQDAFTRAGKAPFFSVCLGDGLDISVLTADQRVDWRHRQCEMYCVRVFVDIPECFRMLERSQLQSLHCFTYTLFRAVIRPRIQVRKIVTFTEVIK